MEDNIKLDDEEISELYENSEELSPEDIFKAVTIDRARQKSVRVELWDEEDDVVELKDVIQELLEYIKNKTEDKSEEGNQFVSQILPLMAQSTVSGLGRMIGIPATAFYLADDTVRIAIIQMMAVALLLLKFVQEKDLKIHTYEEDVTEEELEELDRKFQANKTVTLAAFAGADPKAVLEELRNQGKITDQDLEDLLGDKLPGDRDEWRYSKESKDDDGGGSPEA